MKKKKSINEAETSGQDSLSNTAAEDDYKSTLARMTALNQVPERDLKRTQTSRQAFLAQASNLAPAVSNHSKSRRMGWTSIFRKERSPMFNLARIVVLAALTLGGTGVTAYAAQESLPDQALYPVKTWIEDVRLALAGDPQSDFDLLQGFASERMEEIEALIDQGLPVSTQVSTRLHQHLQQMLQIAAAMDDPELLQAMQQVQTQSRVQVQLIEKLQAKSPENVDALQLATRAIQNVRNSADDAIQDPVSFRLQQATNRSEEAGTFPENGPANGEGQSAPDNPGQGSPGPGSGKGNGQ